MASSSLVRSLRPRPTPAELFCLVLGGALCLTYAWLLDDAYVYFKYVDNWVLLGRGLVYNPGEYAEGYTSPAWLLLLSGLRALGLGYWLVIRASALLGLVVFWWGCVVIQRLLAAGAAPTLNLPLVLLCTNYAVLSYFSSGTEAPLVQLCAVAYAFCLLRPESRAAQVAVGVSPLVRPELGLAWLLAGAWLGWSRRRTPWWLIASGVLTGGGWLLFRVLYYADLFPTTFYLKGGANPGQGLRYLHDAFGPYHLYLWLALGLGASILAARGRWEPRSVSSARVAMLAIASAVAGYVVWVGGDARHYRYLAFSIPLCLLSFGGLAEAALWRAGASLSPAVASLGAVALAVVTAAQHPHQLDRHPLPQLTLPERFAPPELSFIDGIADAESHRRHRDLVPLSPWASGAAIELMPRYEAWRRNGGADPPARIQGRMLCWLHYEHFDRWSVHGFGLTDAVLARARGWDQPGERPAHKAALPVLARDIVRTARALGRPPQRGFYREAVAAGIAPPWMRSNLDTLELLERKLYGPRSAWESGMLALHVWERIELDDEKPPRRAPER